MTKNSSDKSKQSIAAKVIARKTPSARELRFRRLGRLIGLPLLLYFVLFCIFTWPWIGHFNTHYFTDAGDGLQNVWNMWWVDKSVTQLHQSPWYTTYLHVPFGVTLVAQTLNPINGFIGIILQHVFGLSLVQAFNTMIIFSFVSGGLFMFWLCRYMTRAYVPSLIGGAIFTFSSYHFSHAIGHMQLVSLEFIPLYVLLLWQLLRKPSYRLAVGTALVLLAVLFCDYYYFLYSSVLSVFIVVYLVWRKEVTWAGVKRPRYWRPLAVFIVLSLCIIAPLPVALLQANKGDALAGSHDALVFSTDILSPFIDGGFWRFSHFTNFYYRNIRGFTSETTVYLGLSVLTLLAAAIWKRTKIHRDVVFWLLVAVFFGIMSLGPRLLIDGNTVDHAPLPYAVMEHLVPSLKLSGVPVRMMVMTTFAAAIISAMVLANVRLDRRRGQLLIGIFCLILFVEMFPHRLPYTSATQPKYVLFLKTLPAGAVLDDAAKSEPEQLFHQTGSEHPMILGYVSRTPKKVIKEELPLLTDIGTGRYASVCSRYHLRYITTLASQPLKANLLVVYHDHRAIIYDINSKGC